MAKKTTTIYTRRKTKAIVSINSSREWEKSEYNLLRAKKIRVKKGIGKIAHDLWIEKRMWEIYEKNQLMKKINEPNKNNQVQRLGKKYRNRNKKEKNRQQRWG